MFIKNIKRWCCCDITLHMFKQSTVNILTSNVTLVSNVWYSLTLYCKNPRVYVYVKIQNKTGIMQRYRKTLNLKGREFETKQKKRSPPFLAWSG